MDTTTATVSASFEKIFFRDFDFVSFDDFDCNMFYSWLIAVPLEQKELTISYETGNRQRYRIRYRNTQTGRLVSINGKGKSKKEQLYYIASILSGRPHYQMDEESPIEPLITDTAGNTEITTDTPPAEVPTTDGISETMKELCNTANDFEFPKLTDRWNLLENGFITTTDFRKEILLPQALFKASNLGVATLNVFKNFVYSDTELEIRIMVNCPKFSQGRLIISWFPDPSDGVSTLYLTPAQLAQRDHVFLDLASDGEAIIKLPQQYRRTFIRNLKTSTTSTGMAYAASTALQICSIINYECGTDQPSQVPYQMFFRFTKAELSGMSYVVEYQMLKAAWDTAATVLPEVALADRLLKKSGFIRNHDKPPDNRNQYITPRARFPSSHGKGLSDATPLTLDPFSVVVHDPSYFAANDPVTSLDVASKWGLHSIFEWSASKKRGETIFMWLVNPVPLVSPLKSGIYYETLYTTPTPLAMASSIYAFWRGEIDVRLDFVGTQYHTGTVQVDISFNRFADTLEESASTYTKTLKVGAETSFEFSIPYIYDTPWRPTHDQLSYCTNRVGEVGIPGNAETGHPMGLWLGRANNNPFAMRPTIRTQLKITVVNALNPLAQVVDHMKVMMFVKAGKGYQLHSLVNSPYNLPDFKNCQPNSNWDANSGEGRVGYIKTPLYVDETPQDPHINSDRAWTKRFIINEDTTPQTRFVSQAGFHTTDSQLNIKDICRRGTFWGTFTTAEFRPKDSIDVDRIGTKAWVMQRTAIPVMVMNMLNDAAGLHQIHTGSPLSVFSTLHRHWRGKMEFTFILTSESTKPIYFAYVPNRGTLYNGIVRTPITIEKFYGQDSDPIIGGHTKPRRLAAAGFAWEVMIPTINRTIKISVPFDTEFNRAVNCVRFNTGLMLEDKTMKRVQMRDDVTGHSGHIYIETDEPCTFDCIYHVGDDFEFSNFIGAPHIAQTYFFNSDTNYEQNIDQTDAEAIKIQPRMMTGYHVPDQHQQTLKEQKLQNELNQVMLDRKKLNDDINRLQDLQSDKIHEARTQESELWQNTVHSLRQDLSNAQTQYTVNSDGYNSRIRELQNERDNLIRELEAQRAKPPPVINTQPVSYSQVREKEPVEKPQVASAHSQIPRNTTHENRPQEPKKQTGAKPKIITPIPTETEMINAISAYDKMSNGEKRAFEMKYQTWQFDQQNEEAYNDFVRFTHSIEQKYGLPMNAPAAYQAKVVFQMDGVPIVDALGVVASSIAVKKINSAVFSAGKVITSVDQTQQDFKDTMKQAQTTMGDVSSSLKKLERLDETIDQATSTLCTAEKSLLKLDNATEKISKIFGEDASELIASLKPVFATIGKVSDVDIRSMSTDLIIDILIYVKNSNYSTLGLICSRYITKFFKISIFDISKFVPEINRHIGRIVGSLPTEQVAGDETSPWSGLFATFVALVSSILKFDAGKVKLPSFKEFKDNLSYKTISGMNQTFMLAKRIFETISAAITWVFDLYSPESKLRAELRKQKPEIQKLVADIDVFMDIHNQTILSRPHMKAQLWITYSKAITLRQKLLDANTTSVSTMIMFLNKFISHCHDNFPILGCCPAKYEPFIIAVEGVPEIGKSYISEDLGAQMLKAIGYPLLGNEFTYYHTSGKKHFDGYKKEHLVFVMDDWMNAKYPEDCADTLRIHNVAKSPAQFIVPMAALEDKGVVFQSRIMFTMCNNAYPENQISLHFQDVGAIYRRRDYVVKATLIPEYEGQMGRNIPVEVLEKFEHLNFQLLDIKTGTPISSTMNYKTFAEMMCEKFKTYDQRMRDIIKKKLIRNSRDLPEIFRDVADPLDFNSIRECSADPTGLPSRLILRRCEALLDSLRPARPIPNVSDWVTVGDNDFSYSAILFALSCENGLGEAERYILKEWIKRHPEYDATEIDAMIMSAQSKVLENTFFDLYDYFMRIDYKLQSELLDNQSTITVELRKKVGEEIILRHAQVYGEWTNVTKKLVKFHADAYLMQDTMIDLRATSSEYHEYLRDKCSTPDDQLTDTHTQLPDDFEFPEIPDDRITGFWSRMGDIIGVNKTSPQNMMEKGVVCDHCGRIEMFMYGSMDHHVCHTCFGKEKCTECPARGIAKRLVHSAIATWLVVAAQSPDIWKIVREKIIGSVERFGDMIYSFILEMEMVLPKILALYTSLALGVTLFITLVSFIGRLLGPTKRRRIVPQQAADYEMVINERNWKDCIEHTRTVKEFVFSSGDCKHNILLESDPVEAVYLDGRFVVSVGESTLTVDLPPFACGRTCCLKKREAEYRTWVEKWKDTNAAMIEMDFETAAHQGGPCWQQLYKRVPPMYREALWDLQPEYDLFDKHVYGNSNMNPIYRRLLSWIDSLCMLYRKYEYVFHAIEAAMAAIGTLVSVMGMIRAVKNWFSPEKTGDVVQGVAYDKTQPRKYGFKKPVIRAFKTKKIKVSKLRNEMDPQNIGETREGILDRIYKNMFALVVKLKDGNVLASMFCLGVRDNDALMPRHYLAYIFRAIEKYGVEALEFKLHSCYWPAVCRDYKYCEDDFSPAENMDLCAFNTGKVLHTFCNITKYFATDSQMQTLPRTGAFLMRPTSDIMKHTMVHEQVTISGALQQIQADGGGSVENVIQYDFSMMGACGSPLILPNTTTPIAGFHILGSPIGALKRSGYAAMITKELLDEFFTEEAILEDDLREDFSAEPTKLGFDDWVSVQCLGKVDAPYMPTKSKIKPSLIAPVIGESSKKMPCFLSKKSEGYPHEVSPLIAGCNKHGIATGNFSSAEISEVRQALWDARYSRLKPVVSSPGYLGLRDAIAGIDIEGYDGVDLSTSMGYPWIYRAQKKKSDYIEVSTEQFRSMRSVKIHPELHAMVLEEKDYRTRGIIPRTTYLDWCKDELRKIEKAMSEGGTRVFCMAPVTTVIAERRNYLHFTAAYKANRVTLLDHAVGISTDGPQWGQLVDQLRAISPHIVTIDYSNFGPGYNMAVNAAGRDIINRWTLENVAGVDARELELLSIEHSESVHIMGDCVYRQLSGGPSGGTLTVENNGMVNELYLLLAWRTLAKERCRELKMALYDAYYSHVKAVVYGDDAIIAVSPTFIDVFNGITIPQFFAKYNIVATDAAKTGDLVSHTTIHEATFLKHGFKKHAKRVKQWLAPLDETSVIETANWIKRSDCDEDQTRGNADASLRNAFGHGPEYFHKHKEMLNAKLIEMDIEPLTLNWEDLEESFFEGIPLEVRHINEPFLNLPKEHPLSDHSLTVQNYTNSREFIEALTDVELYQNRVELQKRREQKEREKDEPIIYLPAKFEDEPIPPNDFIDGIMQEFHKKPETKVDVVFSTEIEEIRRKVFGQEMEKTTKPKRKQKRKEDEMVGTLNEWCKYYENKLKGIEMPAWERIAKRRYANGMTYIRVDGPNLSGYWEKKGERIGGRGNVFGRTVSDQDPTKIYVVDSITRKLKQDIAAKKRGW